jgi:hypothetical protein
MLVVVGYELVVYLKRCGRLLYDAQDCQIGRRTSSSTETALLTQLAQKLFKLPVCDARNIEYRYIVYT